MLICFVVNDPESASDADFRSRGDECFIRSHIPTALKQHVLNNEWNHHHTSWSHSHFFFGGVRGAAGVIRSEVFWCTTEFIEAAGLWLESTPGDGRPRWMGVDSRKFGWIKMSFDFWGVEILGELWHQKKAEVDTSIKDASTKTQFPIPTLQPLPWTRRVQLTTSSVTQGLMSSAHVPCHARQSSPSNASRPTPKLFELVMRPAFQIFQGGFTKVERVPWLDENLSLLPGWPATSHVAARCWDQVSQEHGGILEEEYERCGSGPLVATCWPWLMSLFFFNRGSYATPWEMRTLALIGTLMNQPVLRLLWRKGLGNRFPKMETCSEPLLNLHDTVIYASVHVQQAQSSFYVAPWSLLIPISTGLPPPVITSCGIRLYG